MKKFSLIIPVFNQSESTLETLESYYSHAKYPEDISLTIVDNGSNPPVAKWIVPFTIKYPLVKINIFRNESNVGVAKALNQGWKSCNCNPDFILFSHSDVEIFEDNWDEKLRNWLDKFSSIGVVGFGGAKGFGTSQLYKEPYIIWQLARTDFLSNMINAESHGRRMTNEIEPCAVLDGFILCVNTKLLKKINGFDENYIFHMYDNDICLQSLYNGYYNFVLNISCRHNGGRTSTRLDYDTWLRDQGIDGDSEIHEKAHIYFYNKWKQFNFIPLVIKP